MLHAIGDQSLSMTLGPATRWGLLYIFRDTVDRLSVVGPMERNLLPDSLWDAARCINNFRSALKTPLFGAVRDVRHIRGTAWCTIQIHDDYYDYDYNYYPSEVNFQHLKIRKTEAVKCKSYRYPCSCSRQIIVDDNSVVYTLRKCCAIWCVTAPSPAPAKTATLVLRQTRDFDFWRPISEQSYAEV